MPHGWVGDGTAAPPLVAAMIRQVIMPGVARDGSFHRRREDELGRAAALGIPLLHFSKPAVPSIPIPATHKTATAAGESVQHNESAKVARGCWNNLHALY